MWKVKKAFKVSVKWNGMIPSVTVGVSEKNIAHNFCQFIHDFHLGSLLYHLFTSFALTARLQKVRC